MAGEPEIVAAGKINKFPAAPPDEIAVEWLKRFKPGHG